MTTEVLGRDQTSACNGVTTAFPVNFSFKANSDLQVFLLDAADDPNEAGTLLVEGVDYTITGIGADVAGQVNTTIAYAAGKFIRRWRATSLSQTADYLPNDGFPSSTTETTLDRLSRVTEERADDLTRTLRAPDGDPAMGPLPKAGDRADKIAGFDNLGNPQALSAADVVTFATPAAVARNLARAELAGTVGVTVGMARVLVEAGRFGIFIAQLAAPWAAAIAADVNKGVMVPSTTDATIVFVRQDWLNGIALNPRWFGAPVDNGVSGSDDGAINAAYRFAEATAVTASQVPLLYRGGRVVDLGQGRYYIAAPLEPLATVKTTGAGGLGWGAPTQVRCAAGIEAIRAQAYNTSGATNLDGVTHFSGDALVFEDIYFIGGFDGTAEAEVHGCRAKRAIHLNRCTFDNFAGDALYGHAIAGGGAPNEGNVNVLRATDCVFTNCRSGTSAQWADANAWTLIGCSLIGNRRWGVEDRSFLGNHYYGAHFDSNARTAWNTGAAGRPCSYVSQGGNQYFVIDGQEAGASVNAPTGTTADNAWWGFFQAGGASPTTGVPAWFNGIAVRSGGPFLFAGLNSGSDLIGSHVEINGMSQSDQLGLDLGSEHGFAVKVSAGVLSRNRRANLRGGSAGLATDGNFNVAGDLTGSSATNYFGPTSGTATDSILELTNTNTASIIRGKQYPAALSYGEIWLSYAGIVGMLVRGTSKIRFDIGAAVGTEIANFQADGFHVTGLGAFSGALTASNLSGTNTGDQFQAIAQNTILGRTAAGAGPASALAVLPTACVVAFAGGDVTSPGASLVLTIANNAVTYGKFQQVAASSLVGNPTGGLANAQGITLGVNLGFSGTTLQVQFAATAKLLGRTTAGAGAAEEIAVANGITLSGLVLGLGAITPTSVAATGIVTSSGGLIGYATGAGGTVAQLTSKTTAVTLNKVCGQFTTNAASLAAGATATFQVNNSNISSTDVLNINLQSGQATVGTYRYWIEKVAAGSFQVTIENRSAGALLEALVFNFAAQKAVPA